MPALRPDLEWQDAPDDGALLIDPLTQREFALSRAQAVLLRTFAEERDIHRTAEIAGAILDIEIDPELVQELLDVFDALALLTTPDATPERVRARQREARRRHHEQSRSDKLCTFLADLRQIAYYARVLPDPLPAFDSLADLARLPVLDKDTLRAHFDDFLPDAPTAELRWLSTSGTTGERQQVVRSQTDWAASQPWTWTLNRHVRAVLGARFCRLTTPFCDGTACHLQRASRADRTRGRRLALETGLDIASFADERIERMVREMREHEPEYVLADPTYLAIVADHALRLRLRLPRVRLVLTSYELCSALHRRQIEQAFECPVYDAYGASEYGALAVQCEAGRYHINPESFIVELDDTRLGRMRVTTLDKKVMPLLRYDTGDLARAADGPCSCMWSETDTLASLEGRAADVITATDGAPLTAGAVDRAVASAAHGIVSYCLVQRSARVYRLEFLPASDFRDTTIAGVLDALHALLGPGAELRAERRRELLPAPSGKFRLSCIESRSQPARLA